MTVWVLIDLRPGTGNQALAVAEALSQDFIKIPLQYNKLADAPNVLLWPVQMLVHSRAITLTQAQILPDRPPSLIISAGRKAAFVARHFKTHRYPAARIVQIMDPQWQRAAFDLLAIPAHDDTGYQGLNLLRTDGNPHRVTSASLQTAKTEFAEILAGLPPKKIALLLGGPTANGKGLTEIMGMELLRAVNAAAMTWQAGVMVATSRRTPDSLVAKIAPYIAAPKMVYNWRQGGKNPYLGYLAHADAIIVTGDSTAMISEACATGKPVFIHAPDGMVQGKQARFIEALLRNRLADPFTDSVHFTPPATTLANPAETIVEVIRRRFGA